MPSNLHVSVFAEDADRRRDTIQQHRQIAGDIGVQVVDGGIILPLRDARDGVHLWEGGVLDSTGSFVAGHVNHPTRTHDRNILSGYEPAATPQYLAESVVYAGGSGSLHFGHFLTETLSRLWWFVANRGSSLRVVFNTQGFTVDHHLMQFIRMLGIPDDQVLFLDQPTQFESVIIPDQAFFLGSGDYHLDAMRLIFDTIRDSVSPGTTKKLYLTRTGFQGRAGRLQEINERLFEDFYREQGFEIVAPETLSLPEQISLVAGASQLATTSGTLSHLVLFSPNDVAQDILLRNPRSLKLEGQWGMSQFRASSVSVVDATLQLLPGSHGWGVAAYAANQNWANFVYAKFGVNVGVEEVSAELLRDIIKAWTEVLSQAASAELRLYPAWTVADFVSSFHEALFAIPLTNQATGRLGRRFGSHKVPASATDVTVTFEPNGGRPVAPQTTTYGGRISPPRLEAREGFNFEGWFTSPRLRTPFDFSSELTNSRTLHAKWTQVGKSRLGRV